MAYYSRDEQETLLNYAPYDGFWRVSTTYPPHIRRLREIAADARVSFDDQGRAIEVSGQLDANQVRLFKPL